MSETEKSAPASAPAQASAPAPASAPAGGKNNTKLIVIIVIVLVVLGAIGYGAQRFFARKVAENIVEKSLESATGGKVDVNSSDGGVTVTDDSGTTSTGSNAKWPATMPADVPEFKSGTMSYSSASTTEGYAGWNVMYSGVTAANATAYFASLTSKGWTQTDSTDSSVVTNRIFEKGTLRLVFTITPSTSEATLSVNNI